MGVERAVTRWYVQRQRLMGEIAALASQLEQAQAGQADSDSAAERQEIEQRLAVARQNLQRLGPCPKPMMG